LDDFTFKRGTLILFVYFKLYTNGACGFWTNPWSLGSILMEYSRNILCDLLCLVRLLKPDVCGMLVITFDNLLSVKDVCLLACDVELLNLNEELCYVAILALCSEVH